VEVLGLEVLAFVNRAGALQAFAAAARGTGAGVHREAGAAIAQATIDFVEREDKQERKEAIAYLDSRAKEAGARVAVLDAEMRQKRAAGAPDSDVAALQQARDRSFAERQAYLEAKQGIQRTDLLGRRM